MREAQQTAGMVGDPCPAGEAGDNRHAVTYFDWAAQRVRLMGPLFETKDGAVAYADQLKFAFDDVRVIPAHQIPHEERPVS